MTRLVVLFQTTRAAIKAEKICQENNIQCKAIPVPRGISSNCGIALELDPSLEPAAEQLFKIEQIPARFCSLS